VEKMKAKDILKQLITKKISVKEVTQKYLENINKIELNKL